MRRQGDLYKSKNGLERGAQAPGSTTGCASPGARWVGILGEQVREYERSGGIR